MHFLGGDKEEFFFAKKISEFLNSGDFEASFKQGKLINFIPLDLLGKQYPEKEINEYSSIKRTMWFKSMRAFYLGLILTTLLQGLLYPYKGNYFISSSKKMEVDKDSIIIANQNKTIQELIQIIKNRDTIKTVTCH